MSIERDGVADGVRIVGVPLRGLADNSDRADHVSSLAQTVSLVASSESGPIAWLQKIFTAIAVRSAGQIIGRASSR